MSLVRSLSRWGRQSFVLCLVVQLTAGGWPLPVAQFLVAEEEVPSSPPKEPATPQPDEQAGPPKPDVYALPPDELLETALKKTRDGGSALRYSQSFETFQFSHSKYYDGIMFPDGVFYFDDVENSEVYTKQDAVMYKPKTGSKWLCKKDVKDAERFALDFLMPPDALEREMLALRKNCKRGAEDWLGKQNCLWLEISLEGKEKVEYLKKFMAAMSALKPTSRSPSYDWDSGSVVCRALVGMNDLMIQKLNYCAKVSSGKGPVTVVKKGDAEVPVTLSREVSIELFDHGKIPNHTIPEDVRTRLTAPPAPPKKK